MNSTTHVSTENSQSSIKALLQATRLPFLILTPICLFLGFALANGQPAQASSTLISLTFICAVSAHIAVNLLNEYQDFQSGLDLITSKTPFSGGSGALPSNPNALNQVKIFAIVMLAITIISGGYIVLNAGHELFPIGSLGLVIVLVYTQWINKHPWICLIAPGTAFGYIMVVSAYFIQAGTFDQHALVVATIPFFLVNNLLLLNQYPDATADSQVGRKHLIIATSYSVANIIYALNWVAASLVCIYLLTTDMLPTLAALALIPLPLGLFALKGAIRHGANIGDHPQHLAANVILTLVTPLLLAIGLIYG